MRSESRRRGRWGELLVAVVSATALAAALAPSAGALPDGRQWELVSPSEKQSGRLEGLTNEGGLIQAAAGGGALAYVSQGPIVPEPEGNPSIGYSQLLSVRREAGTWNTADLATPHEAPTGVQVGSNSEYFAFTDDLSSALVEQPRGDETPLAVEPGEAKPEKTPYIRANLLEAGTHQYQRLLGAADVGPAVKYGEEVEALAGTPDLNSVVLYSKTSLIEGEPELGLYEWVPHAAIRLKPVSLLPNGTPVAFTGAFLGQRNRNMRHAVSTDGTKVFWTAGTAPNEHLYARNTSTGVTTQADAAQGVEEPASGHARFQDATPNGERVFFTDTNALTPDSGAAEGNQDLYEFNTVSRTLHDLTPAPGVGLNADVLGNVLGTSEDGSRVYFVANAILAPGAAAGGCQKLGGPEAEPGATCNLYSWHNGVTKLVAILSSEDEPVWSFVGGGSLSEDLLEVTSRVSPSGEYVAFMSNRSLTGYDNRDAVSGVPDEEVFEYRSTPGAERAVCVSCNPTGARPHGVLDTGESGEGIGLLVDRPQAWDHRWLAASVPGYTAVTHTRAVGQARFVLDNGRLFFNSADGLSSADTNGKEDVYAFEPPGVGTCGTASPDFVSASSGCVALLSSGSSGKESAFLDASTSGDDVFFLSSATLTTNDTDSAYDVYDAHVCSLTVPCSESGPASSQPCTSNDSCQGIGGVEGIDAGPATEAIVGPGNLKPAAKQIVKPPTRAQRLAKALHACSKVHNRRQRASCRKAAYKRYGPIKKHTKPTK
jgi:hypothetical protein